ncbi:MAG: tRNA (adenosine(37)-N6)-dimethylallyltransferase MiaA, partial [Patescibacteria group bacterium]|nr:tRNA (adenosine(37)-N6)-dimethylallyltransferase MiaA [Patescibacteria group bacterium]
MQQSKVLVIVGPTASGKTSLAIDLAKQFDGEIICADSRTIYQGMDIGTAKPTIKQQDGIKHHLLDIVKPDEVFSASDFKIACLQAIKDIKEKHKLPIICGGSGL